MEMHVVGPHAVTLLLKRFPNHVREVWLSKSVYQRFSEIRSLCERNTVDCRGKANEVVKAATSHANQGVVAFATQWPTLGLNVLLERVAKAVSPPLFLILDRVQDPYNLGACLRTAAAFGVEAVIVSKHHSVGLTPTVVKVSCGGALVVPLVSVTNLSQCITKLKKAGVWVYAASEHATTSLSQADSSVPIAWVMGNEGGGVAPGIMKHCDATFSIDVSKGFSTLNVSVSTGICLYETQRSRELLKNRGEEA